MTLDGQSVVVIGAGIAGLAVAQALAMRGAAVTVLEQAARLEDVGAGIQISPNGAVVLRALGLGDAFDAASLANHSIVLHNQSGRTLLRMDLAGRDYRLLHRADLIGLLAQGAIAAGAILRFRTAVVGIGPSQVELANGEVMTAPLILGADGVRSRLRSVLNQVSEPFFTGQVAWRAVIPGDGGAVEAQVFMAPGRHLVSYPLRGGRQRNIVAVEERDEWAAESWSNSDHPGHLCAAFAGFGPRVQGWLAQVKEVGLWGLFRHRVADRWYGDGLALLGDAAHPTLPFLAQGANMALEDAWVLATALGLHQNQATALAAYQSARRNRTIRIVKAANANAKVYHASGLRRLALHTAMRAAGAIAPAQPLARFNWLYSENVTKEP